MAILSGPYEILELPDRGELVSRALRWEVGTMEIQPRDGRPRKEIEAVRIHVPLEDKGHLPAYWDVTAQRLKPSLISSLPDAVRQGRYFKIQKFGFAPTARFTFELFAPGDRQEAFYGVRP